MIQRIKIDCNIGQRLRVDARKDRTKARHDSSQGRSDAGLAATPWRSRCFQTGDSLGETAAQRRDLLCSRRHKGEQPRRLQKDVADPRLQRVHRQALARHRAQAEGLWVLIVDGIDKADRLAGPTGGVADDGGKDDGPGHTVDQWLLGRLGAQLLQPVDWD